MITTTMVYYGYATKRILLLCLMTSTLASSYSNSDENVLQDERYLKGKEKYALFKKETAMPKYSACWTNALLSLESGCRHLTDDTQHRLALAFSNCFLKKTGRTVYECPGTDTVESCTGEMSPEAYNVYTEFFTHTQNICYFLQAQSWQEETDDTIDRLAENSAHVARQIEDSSELQSQVILKQNESIKNQEILLHRGNELKKTLEESTVDVHSMLQEFKVSTIEQKALIFEVFDRLTALQNIVMGEFTGFYSLIFYTVSVLVCYLLTSTPRTSSARFWLFLLMTINIIMERTIVAWGCEQYQDAESGIVIDENTQIYCRLWWSRKVFSVVGVLMWLRCAIVYQDFNQINNTLLVEIRKQNSDLKHLLQTGTPKSAPPAIDDTCSFLNNAVDTTDLSMIHNESVTANKISSWDITPSLTPSFNTRDSTTGYESDSDTSTVSSFNTMMTDRTFTASHLGDVSDSDSESFCTGVSHASSLADELRFLREATPLREMSSYFHEADVSNSADASLNSTNRRKPGRPRGSKNQKHTPSQLADSVCRYNLRNRLSSLENSPNPMVRTETAEDFGRMVHHLAMVSHRNKVKAEATVARNHPGSGDATHKFFSSDDD